MNVCTLLYDAQFRETNGIKLENMPLKWTKSRKK